VTVARRPLLDLARTVGRGESMRLRLRDRGLEAGRPAVVADALLRSIRRIDVPGIPGGRDHWARLLVLPKVAGTEDVVAAVAARPEAPLALLGLPRREAKAAFRVLVGPGHESITDLDHRLDDDATLVGRERYRRFLQSVMHHLREELDIAGVVSANVTYHAERDLGGACEDIDLPFLVLHKESIRSPRQREWFTRAYRERTGPFLGRAVAVYNRDERDSQVAGGTVRDATVVGAPRVDGSHAVRRARPRPPSDGPTVLFSIDPRAGTWTPFDGLVETGAPRWEGLARRTEDAFLSTARERPRERFVIKAKVGHGEQLIERLPAGLPDNVEVLTDGTADALLREASAIVGFNTTVLAEGLAAAIPVLVPTFAEAAEAGAEAWCYPLGDAVVRVSEPAHLSGALEEARRGGGTSGELDPSISSTLDTLVGNSDGLAAVRTSEWMFRELGLA